MKPVFDNPALLEKNVKASLCFPEFIMMENAAGKLCETILEEWDRTGDYEKLIIACGKGNNGADGFACARMLYGKIPVFLLDLSPSADIPGTERSVQKKVCEKLGVPFITEEELFKNRELSVYCDCIFGTGFHGELPENISRVISFMNDAPGFRIACDIPSALAFRADVTVTMGSRKAVLYSDRAADFCGEIILSELGISETVFEKYLKTDIFLLEESDVTLPFRKTRNTHKGKYGHSAVFAGEKSGAAILSVSAAARFGSGLSTLVRSSNSNIEQFRVSPGIMISDCIPKNASAVQIGSGLGKNPESLEQFTYWFKNAKNPACVLDADIFALENLKDILELLNAKEDSRIVLTPHPKELASLCFKTGITEKEITAQEALENRLELGRNFTKTFPNITLIMKGANTFIASAGKTYIFTEGAQSLSKGGSGDVLAGMVTSLLAQGYTGVDAAITAVWHHGTTARLLGQNRYSLTPEELVENI